MLKIGSAGPDVRRLQRALSAADNSAKVTATGVYDLATDAALRAWQERVGLPVTGSDGPERVAEALEGHAALVPRTHRFVCGLAWFPTLSGSDESVFRRTQRRAR